MANPQIENGFTKIANELLEEIIKRDFSKRELKVIFSVIRFTFGFHRKEAELSLRFISESTGIKFHHLSTTINDLATKNILILSENETRKQGRILKLNKDYDTWNINSSQNSNSSQKGNGSVPKKVTDLPKTVTLSGTKKERYKENIKKEENNLHALEQYVIENCPDVSKLKQQLTKAQCEKLTSEFNMEVILQKLDAMENYKPLTKKYKSVYGTLKNWLKRDNQKQKSQQQTNLKWN
jgi:phage replication O-like protein O